METINEFYNAFASVGDGNGPHTKSAANQKVVPPPGRRSIAATVRYTALAPDRFKHFWKD
jgi:hypothetical protein